MQPCVLLAAPFVVTMVALEPLLLARIFVCVMLAVLFLQSGVDKVVDRKGNLEWMVPHFAKSPFGGTVPMMLSVLTVFELLTGLGGAVSVVVLLVKGPLIVPIASIGLACLTFLMLFTGQRLAKDYAGAASLAAYSILPLIGLTLFAGA